MTSILLVDLEKQGAPLKVEKKVSDTKTREPCNLLVRYGRISRSDGNPEFDN